MRSMMPVVNVDLPLPDVPATRMFGAYGSRVSARSPACPSGIAWRESRGASLLEVRGEQAIDELRDAVAVIRAGHSVGLLAQRGHGVGHRDAALADREKRMVVLGVADPDDVVRGQPELAQRRPQAARLVDAGGVP